MSDVSVATPPSEVNYRFAGGWFSAHLSVDPAPRIL